MVAAKAKFCKLLKQHGNKRQFWQDMPTPPSHATLFQKTKPKKRNQQRRACTKKPKSTPRRKTTAVRRKRKKPPTRRKTPAVVNDKPTPTVTNDMFELQFKSLEKRIMDATTAACAAVQAARAATTSVNNFAAAEQARLAAEKNKALHSVIETQFRSSADQETQPRSSATTPPKRPSKRKDKRHRHRRRHRSRSSSLSPGTTSSESSVDSPRTKRLRRRLLKKATRRAFNMCQMMTYSPIISSPPLIRRPPVPHSLTQYMQNPFQHPNYY